MEMALILLSLSTWSTACGVRPPVSYAKQRNRHKVFLQEIGLLVRSLTKGPVDRTTLLELIAQLGIQLRYSFNPQVGVSQESPPAQRSPDSVGIYSIRIMCA